MSSTYAYKRVIEIVDTRATVCLFPRCGIQHLPVELVVNILSELDTTDIVLWQGVSRHFRDLIANSVTLQYLIACCDADVLDEPLSITRNKTKQINAIREWKRRWDTADWKLVVATDGTSDGDATLGQVGAITRAAVMREHDFSDIPGVLGYGCDVEKGVVVTAQFDEGNRQWVRLIARDINTKVPYPIQHYSGRLTFIMPVPLDDPDASHVDVVVHGTRVMASGSYHHHIAFGVEGIEDVDVYWLYDWESGKAFLNFWTNIMEEPKMESYEFIDERCMLMTINDSSKQFLAVFDCYKWRSSNTPRLLSIKQLMGDALLVLALPTLRKGNYCQFIRSHHQPRRERLPANFSDAKFIPANSWPIIHVAFAFTKSRINLNRNYQLLIPHDTIDSLISQHIPFTDDRGRTGPVMIPWDDWGEETRFFRGKSAFGGSPVSDSRYVTKELDPKSNRWVVVIYDFCASWKMLHDLAHDGDEDVMIEVVPSIVTDPDCFVEPIIETKAPYRRIETSIVLEDYEEPTLTEDAIILLDQRSFPYLRTRAFCI